MSEAKVAVLVEWLVMVREWAKYKRAIGATGDYDELIEKIDDVLKTRKLNDSPL